MALKIGSTVSLNQPKKPTTNPVSMQSEQAAVLYQPVDGTSNTYNTFCYNDKVVVAVRLKGVSSVSIRVEARPGFALSGTLAPFVKFMKTLGIEGKGGYLSGHMGFPDLTLCHVLAPIAFNPACEWSEVARDLTKF